MARDYVFVAALCLARVAFGYQFQGLATIGPELLERFHIDYAALGTLIGAFMLPGVFVALPGGLLGRRFGARTVVGIGLLLMTAGSLLPLLVFTPGGIAAGRIVAGVGAAVFLVMQGKMVADRFDPAHGFLLVMALLVAGFPVGVGLAGLTHEAVQRGAGPTGLFLVGGVLSAVSLALFLPSIRAEPPAPTRWALPPRRECALVLVAGLIWSAYNVAYGGFLSYMPSLLAARGHSPAASAWVMVAATWSNLPAMLAGGALAMRFGQGRIFLVGTVSLIAAAAGAAFVDWPLSWGLLFGTVGSMQAGVIVGLGTLSTRAENRAVGMGLFYTVYYIGGAIMPVLCGRAADLAGSPAGALQAAAALATLALPFYAWHQRMQRRQA